MATELGKAYVQIMPSAKGISDSIKKELDPGVKDSGVYAGGKLVAALKGVIATAAIGKFLAAALTEGGQLQQSIGGVETLFKDHADKVKEYAKEAYMTVGVSANEYMSSVTSFSASMLQSLSGDTKKAADYANVAMVDMADNANKMGTPLGSIQDAYQGFAKQNFTMLDNLKLGFGGTKTEMERLLVEAEKISGIKYDISSFADITQAIHVIQNELGITGTTAEEASKTLQGSFMSMKASFNNVLGSLSVGEDVKSHLSALAKTTATFVFNNLIPMVGNIVKGVPSALVIFVQESIPYVLQAGKDFISNLSSGITAGLPELLSTGEKGFSDLLDKISENLPQFLEKGSQLLKNIVDGVVTALPLLIESAGNITTKFVIFILKNLPVVLDAGAKLILSLVDGFIKNLPTISDSVIKVIGKFIDTVLENLPEIIKTGNELTVKLVFGILLGIVSLKKAADKMLIDFIVMIISKFPDIVKTGAKILMSIVLGILSASPQLYAEITGISTNLINRIDEFKSKFFETGKNIVQGVWNGIESMKNTITKNINKFFSGILDSAKSVLGIHSPSREFQEQVGKNIVLGTVEGIKENENKAVKAASELSQNILTKAKSWVDDKKFFDEMTLKDELEFWQDLKTMKALQAEQVHEIDKSIYSLKKTLQEQENEETKKLLEEQKKAFEEYTNNIHSRAKALESFAGLFDLIEEKNEITGEQLLANLKSQVDAFKQWQSNLESLSNRGISDALLEEFRQLGPKSAQEINALTTLSDNALSKYVELFTEKTKLAREQAQKELGEFSFQSDTVFVNGENEDVLKSVSAKVVDVLKEGLTSNMPKVTEVGEETVINYITAIENKIQAVRNVGRMLTDGLWQGIESGRSGLIANVQAMLDEMVARARAAMQIHSPSRIWAEIGQFMAQGLETGFVCEMDRISRQINRSLPDGKSITTDVAYTLNKMPNEFADFQNDSILKERIMIIQNIYAKTEDERAQQKEAIRNLRNLLPQV